MTKEESEKFVTQAEAARMRGVTRSAIAELIRRGRLRVKELYGMRLVFREDIENFERAKPSKKKLPTKKRAKTKKSSDK